MQMLVDSQAIYLHRAPVNFGKSIDDLTIIVDMDRGMIDKESQELSATQAFWLGDMVMFISHVQLKHGFG